MPAPNAPSAPAARHAGTRVARRAHDAASSPASIVVGRAALGVTFTACVLLGPACEGGADAVCGLPTELPEVNDGFGAATRSDGEAFNAQASWAPGGNASLTIGTLDMVVARDETGTAFDDLLEDGALPFCVPLGERTETSGSAILNSSPVGTSDATNIGGVAVLALEDDVLVGRFEVELSLVDGTTLTFTDGVFRARRR